MTHSSPGVPHLVDVSRDAEPVDETREGLRERRMSLPLRMDDGQIQTVDVPEALAHPSQFSAGELERLTRAYAEALGLINPPA